MFWDGGVDTQGTLHRGGMETIKDNVKRNLEIMRKGGVYIFSGSHNSTGRATAEHSFYERNI